MSQPITLPVLAAVEIRKRLRKKHAKDKYSSGTCSSAEPVLRECGEQVAAVVNASEILRGEEVLFEDSLQNYAMFKSLTSASDSDNHVKSLIENMCVSVLATAKRQLQDQLAGGKFYAPSPELQDQLAGGKF